MNPQPERSAFDDLNVDKQMAPDLEALKRALRGEVTARVAAVSEQDRSLFSARAITLLQKQERWHRAEAVLFYAPLNGELDVWPLLRQALKEGKVVALPRFDIKAGQYIACQVKDLEADLEPGRYGIREPCGRCDPMALKRLDFVFAPGVAFDLHGRRLGRGKGYYDRLLATMRGKACGVAFDEQIVREVPVLPHDSDVNCILTPSRWIEL